MTNLLTDLVEEVEVAKNWAETLIKIGYFGKRSKVVSFRPQESIRYLGSRHQSSGEGLKEIS